MNKLRFLKNAEEENLIKSRTADPKMFYGETDTCYRKTHFH